MMNVWLPGATDAAMIARDGQEEAYLFGSRFENQECMLSDYRYGHGKNELLTYKWQRELRLRGVEREVENWKL